MSSYIDNFIEEAVKEVVEISKILPKESVPTSSTLLFNYKPIEGMQIRIIVGYNLDKDE